MKKRGILAVSFGTTFRDTREKNIHSLTELIREQYPQAAVEEAFSSGQVRRILEDRDGIHICSVREALERLRDEGVSHVAVLPTFVVDGMESNRLKKELEECEGWFEEIRPAPVLLGSEEDYRAVAEALWKDLSREAAGDHVILMGHGTEHEADESYLRAQQALREAAGERLHIVTIEGGVRLEHIMEEILARREEAEREGQDRPGGILLAPFMLVAGDHVTHDMAGEEDSLKSELEAAGFRVRCLIRGMGEYKGIRDIYMRHLQEAVGEGVLYGVGVGCGDPEMMTLKAVRAIEACDRIILPGEPAEECYAYRIADQAVSMEGKKLLCRPFPMIKDREALDEFYDRTYEEIRGFLEAGENVAFLTIGDPSVYSTYGYMHSRALKDGKRAVMISGVPSFAAVAARLGIMLGENAEEIHIIPASYDVEKSLLLPGTCIYMKSGKALGRLKAALQEKARTGAVQVYAVSDCGMDKEKVMRGIEELDESSGYLTTVIVKKR